MDKEWVEVAVLGVGQGACNVICHIREDDSGERELLCMGMVDCGSDDMRPSNAVVNYIRDNMALRKKSQSIWIYPSDYYLDFLVVTHQDKDHLSWLRDVFDGISAPPYLKKGTDEELYSEFAESMTIADPDCRMVDLSRNLRAEYFTVRDPERLVGGRCEENGNLEVNYSQEGFELRGMVKTKGLEFFGTTVDRYYCSLQGEGPSPLRYYIYLQFYNSELDLKVLCGVPESADPVDYGNIEVNIKRNGETDECVYVTTFQISSYSGCDYEFRTDGSLALKELRPYGMDKIITKEFGELELSLFPYTRAFLNGLKSEINNGSSVISAVDYDDPDEGVVFTGDAILESMQELNNFRYTSFFFKPQLMTAPHHGAVKTAARECRGSLDTTVLERFLRNSIQPKRIVVSHGYDFTHGHPHHKSMEVYHKILKELHADCAPHYCYFNIWNCNKSNGAQYQYGWVDTAVYTTVGALDETSETPVEESKSKIVDYILTIPETKSVSLKCEDAFEPGINPLLYKPPVKVCRGFDPEALIEREEEERPEVLIKKQSGQSAFASFVPPFVRER